MFNNTDFDVIKEISRLAFKPLIILRGKETVGTKRPPGNWQYFISWSWWQLHGYLLCGDNCTLRKKNVIEFSSVTQSCPTLCYPMDCSAPSFPVHHQLPELTQTHIHWVSDAIHHLILCHPLLFLHSIFASIRVFSNVSTLHIRWPSFWSSALASVFPMNNQDWSPLGRTGWISLQSKELSRVFSNITVQKHQLYGAQFSV